MQFAQMIKLHNSFLNVNIEIIYWFNTIFYIKP